MICENNVYSTVCAYDTAKIIICIGMERQSNGVKSFLVNRWNIDIFCFVCLSNDTFITIWQFTTIVLVKLLFFSNVIN